MRSSKAHPIAALRDRRVDLYSDLLLHDLGDALADHFPEGKATGRQWRTTPLWGLGLIAKQTGGHAFFLHDGRARTLQQAIDLHGGEASAARTAFDGAATADRQALIDFLASL